MGLSAGKDSKDINVTPLIDVLLVLLVIFLVVMPVMMRMETVDIPRQSFDVEPMPATIVKVRADLSIAIDETTPITAGDLPARLRALHPKLVFVAFEDGVAWNDVIATVDTVRGATDGATVALETQRP